MALKQTTIIFGIVALGTLDSMRPPRTPPMHTPTTKVERVSQSTLTAFKKNSDWIAPGSTCAALHINGSSSSSKVLKHLASATLTAKLPTPIVSATKAIIPDKLRKAFSFLDKIGVEYCPLLRYIKNSALPLKINTAAMTRQYKAFICTVMYYKK